MTRTTLILMAVAGSALLLAGAFAFQYLGGLAPCTLCLWQRWPHAAAVGLGGLALALGGRVWPMLGALAALTTAGIGLYHVGVEQAWWAGLAACSAGSIAGISTADLLNPEVMAVTLWHGRWPGCRWRGGTPRCRGGWQGCGSGLRNASGLQPRSSAMACTRVFRSPRAACTARWRASRDRGASAALRNVML